MKYSCLEIKVTSHIRTYIQMSIKFNIYEYFMNFAIIAVVSAKSPIGVKPARPGTVFLIVLFRAEKTVGTAESTVN